MPVLSQGGLRIEHTDEGQGPPVVLIHSSVSGNRQWRLLTEALIHRYRVLAVNLYGYGETTPWPGEVPQTLEAQARLILAVCEPLAAPVHVVGHSFGGTVALKAATLLDSRLASLVLLEPNPMYLLRQQGRMPAFLEASELREHVQHFGALGDWPRVAERFADYWLGDGAWSAMPEKRRAAFAESLPPNYHEWDAAMDEETGVEQLAAIACRTLVVSDPSTRRPVREVVEILTEACPHWSFRAIDGGHMAPLSRPEVVNPMIREFLDAG